MKVRSVRRIVQFLALPVAYAGFIVPVMTHIIYPSIHCYACPLSVYICPVGVFQNFTKATTFPFYLLGWVVVYGVAAGRAICGWICPFGLLNDILAPINRVKKPKPSLQKLLVSFFLVALFLSAFPLDLRLAIGVFAVAAFTLFALNDLSLIKYFILTLTLVLAFLFADTIFCKSCAVATAEASIPYFFLGLAGKAPIDVRLSLPFLVHLGTLALAVCGIIVVRRFWCRYLCPMGAMLGLLNRTSLITLKRDETACNKGKCSSECIKVCSMGVKRIGRLKVIDSGDCIRCGDCVDACPNTALRLTARFGTKTDRS